MKRSIVIAILICVAVAAAFLIWVRVDQDLNGMDRATRMGLSYRDCENQLMLTGLWRENASKICRERLPAKSRL